MNAMTGVYEKHDKFMAAVGKKVSDAMDDIRKSGNRNEKGLQFSAYRITKSAENLFLQKSSIVNDPVASIYQSFSEKPGLANVGNVAGVDVVDINIMATQQSVLGYVSAERGMKMPTDSLWFQGLKDKNGAVDPWGKNSWVNRPYMPMNKGIVKAVKGASVSKDVTPGTQMNLKADIDAGTQLLWDTLAVTATVGGKTTVIGRYVDGNVFFTDGSTATQFDPKAGTITIATSATDPVISVGIDKTTEKDGRNTLKLKPATDVIQITAQPRRIQLEQSYEDNAYMNAQAFELSRSGVVQDYGRIAVNQLLDTYVKFLDFDSVVTTADGILTWFTNEGQFETFDMSNYIMTTSDVDTKNDKLHKAMLSLNERLMNACGYGYTAILVDTSAATTLGNDKDHFVANATFIQALDGMIGTYDGIPVIRHHALNGCLEGYIEGATATDGVVLGIYKNPDGSLAPTIYGEFLPPYSAVPALNFDNPAQFSQALLSMSMCKSVADDIDDLQLGVLMQIKY